MGTNPKQYNQTLIGANEEIKVEINQAIIKLKNLTVIHRSFFMDSSLMSNTLYMHTNRSLLFPITSDQYTGFLKPASVRSYDYDS